jgi:hypothetical protein
MFMAPVPGFTPTYPNYSILREIGLADGSLLGFLLAHPREMGIKFLSGMLSLYNGIPVLFGIYALPFFIAGMLQRTEEARLRMMKGASYLLLAFLIIGAALMTGAYELLSPLAPMVVILSGAVFWNMLQSRNFAPRARSVAVGVLLVAAAIPAIASLLTPTPPRKFTEVSLQQLDRALPATAIVASDAPWDVAWYGNRTSIWLPNTANPKADQPFDPTQTPEFSKIDGPQHRVKAILLTRELKTSYSFTEHLLGWQTMRYVPRGFKFLTWLPGGEGLLVREAQEQETLGVNDKHKP